MGNHLKSIDLMLLVKKDVSFYEIVHADSYLLNVLHDDEFESYQNNHENFMITISYWQ